MRFLKYLEISSLIKDDAVFRSLNIGLVNKSINSYDEIVESKDKNALKLIEILNKELQKSYKGLKYKFDFISINDNTVSVDNINTTASRKNFLKKMCLDFNSKLAEIQSNYEKKLL